nr:MAG TPA: ribosome, girodazole, girolline, antibiotic complex, 50S [Caudoviricetes sp.]
MPRSQIGRRGILVENMTELVKVDVQCPFCGGCYHRMVKIKPSSICCKVCKKSLFLEWTGSTPTTTPKR